MVTLFLTSRSCMVAKHLPPLLRRPAGECTVAFVATAADPYEAKPFVEEDRDKLREMGFGVEEIDLKGKSCAQLSAAIRDADVLFVAGGMSSTCLRRCRRAGSPR